MPKETKITEVEYQKRVSIVAKLLMKGGMANRDMFRYVTENEKLKWHISFRQFENYIRDAKEEIKDDPNDVLFEKARAKKRFENLYAKNYDLEDYKECRAIIEAESKLFGWGEPEKYEHNVSGGFSIKDLLNFSDGTDKSE